MLLREIVKPREATRFVFFGGKGGVGKSTISAATAVWLADNGYKVLLISTDLQRSLSDIFETEIGYQIKAIPGIPGLMATETDAGALVRENWRKLAATVQTIYGPSELLQLVEQELAGKGVSPCAMEMASFYRVMDLFTVTADEYDSIVFDTAPGGRALVEITLPFAMARRHKGRDRWSEFLGRADDDQAASIAEEERRTQQTIELITNPERTSFIYVLWPESLPIAETERALAELAGHKIDVPGIVVNHVLPLEEIQAADTPFFWKRYEMQRRHLEYIQQAFQDKSIGQVPLLSGEPRGASHLREIGRFLYGRELQ